MLKNFTITHSSGSFHLLNILKIISEVANYQAQSDYADIIFSISGIGNRGAVAPHFLVA